MISVVCVYNDLAALDRILLPSLKSQTAKYELITIDNTKGRYKSAAEALNVGGLLANGRYIMFVHQDIELDSAAWLEDTERILDNIPDLGIAGVIGMSLQGKGYHSHLRGRICSCGQDLGNAVKEPTPVQTLDECLLIIPREGFWLMPFDQETFDGWHGYGCDYALAVTDTALPLDDLPVQDPRGNKLEGSYKAYVIPKYVYHRSRLGNTSQLTKYLIQLYRKHHARHPVIHTTTGATLSRLGVLWTWIRPALITTYFQFAPPLEARLKIAFADCESVLDLGCGYNTPLQSCGIPYTTGVELFSPYLMESMKKALHSNYIKSDVRTLDLPPKSYDGVLCSEVLEHMGFDEGDDLLKKMEQWARKRVIITTPNGFIFQDGYDDNPMQIHHCGWKCDDLTSRGYRLTGIAGWRRLRGYKGRPTIRPYTLGMGMILATYALTQFVPRWDFQLLGIKEVG